MSAPVAHAHHRAGGASLRNMSFSLDHKVIGIQYTSSDSFRLRRDDLWCLMRYQHGQSNVAVPDGQSLAHRRGGGIMTPELYLSLMTMTATIMVFFVLTTVLTERLRQLFPCRIQIGAEDMHSPS